ncbi:MAG: hypothetical protein L3J79_03360 [Candidatus Marinimicrobia bacterium]|nr:hypothetical protein [Candidatus Neomarinimicrobiota bacterium]
MGKQAFTKGKNKTSSKSGLIIMLGIAMLVLAAFVGVMVTDNGISRERVSAVKDNFSAHTLNIASDFRCSCGTCGEKNLAVCTCETALIEKRYIENSLRAGKEHEQITSEMKRIYGHYNES